jgi:hypothetical protein
MSDTTDGRYTPRHTSPLPLEGLQVIQSHARGRDVELEVITRHGPSFVRHDTWRLLNGRTSPSQLREIATVAALRLTEVILATHGSLEILPDPTGSATQLEPGQETEGAELPAPGEAHPRHPGEPF